ncbi:hypothetical protein HK104_011383 [Borealophlyctis nickersoniae]|nr:hypothetical protein HK104_011383 [Borealophlyctis nickersoniae]
MIAHREGVFVEGLWVETSPLSPEIAPPVEEVGCTSAPLESMAYFFNAHCKDYTEDFMLCKNENLDPRNCLKEGRKVTRCALNLIQKLKDNCDKEWQQHWNCLDFNNHELWRCRPAEREFNDCVFKKLGLVKDIPETPEGQEHIHRRTDVGFK